MGGLFGVISQETLATEALLVLAMHSRQRGKGSSGLVYGREEGYRVISADCDVERTLERTNQRSSKVAFGHSSLSAEISLVSNPLAVRDGIVAITDGLIVNAQEIRKSVNPSGDPKNDSALIIDMTEKHFGEGGDLQGLSQKVLSVCQGAVSFALAIPRLGKALLFSNTGDLYVGKCKSDVCFSSERCPLETIKCTEITQVLRQGVILDIPKAETIVIDRERQPQRQSSTPSVKRTAHIAAEEAMLVYPQPQLRRCTKCLLPETMPFISFDSDGVCNYCRNYKSRSAKRPKEELLELVKPYRRSNGPECIVPFSGGRDSSYSLHVIVKELELTPITYTYDWGMITDLGRRNLSRMCSRLGVSNIMIAADISKKRLNIVRNLKAWLKAPNLGMLSMLTAGDKHLFQYVETVRRQTGVELNLWGTNPLETTHFKAGFLGVRPDFDGKKVYMSGIRSQLDYHSHRFRAMLRSPGYFNRSLWDTLSGEYYRSIAKKTDYFHVYDYWPWVEEIVDKTLSAYDWETSPDTQTTWRIGDGTAAFYNYVNYTVAGFTEHDTFRSNQIREGLISREQALELVQEENRPRYQNIRWYLDTLGLDFVEVIKVVNSIPRLYRES